MKIRILHIAILALIPSFAMAQHTDVSTLVEAYAEVKGITYTHLGKGLVWMAKAGAPKGAMDGVEAIDILKFNDGKGSPLYTQFRASADSLFAAIGAECVHAEPSKKGSSEVYMERKEHPTEYMTFMFEGEDQVTFMRMSGNLPSSLE